MYRVIEMYGDFEPWWFLEGWENDIIEEQSFAHFEDALLLFEEEWQSLKLTFPSFESRKNLQASFWDIEDKRWCEDCDDYIQQYHSIMILKGDQVLSDNLHVKAYDQINAAPQRTSSCALKL